MTHSLRPNLKKPSKIVCLYWDMPNFNFLVINVGDAKDKVLAMFPSACTVDGSSPHCFVLN